MTERDVLSGVPEGSVELAYELLDVIEIYNSSHTAPHRFPESLVHEVVEDPTYFTEEGGSDGTFGHTMFQIYDPLQPQLGLFAESLVNPA